MFSIFGAVDRRAMSDRPEAEVYRYEVPESDHPKDHIRFFDRPNSFRGEVQVVKEGGENNLHAHKGVDGFWMVLDGKARFYTSGDKVVAELEQQEAVLIPHGFRYWFETVGEEPAEILHIASPVGGIEDERIDVEEHWHMDERTSGDFTPDEETVSME